MHLLQLFDVILWKDVRCEGWGRLDPPVETDGYKMLDVVSAYPWRILASSGVRNFKNIINLKNNHMGAWGHGYFEDDAAWDFMDEIEAADDPKEVITAALDAAIEAEYLECDEGNAVIVASTYIDRQQNGTIFSSPDRDEPLNVDTFPDRHPGIDFADLKNKAVRALKKLLREDSELNELWADNEELYPEWKQGIKTLIQRLNKT